MYKPPVWRYEPLAVKRARELAQFDTLRDQISPLVANGDSLSLLKAQQHVQAAKVSDEEKKKRQQGFLHKVGDAVRAKMQEMEAVNQGMGNAPPEVQMAADREAATQRIARNGPVPGVTLGVAEANPDMVTPETKRYGTPGSLDEPGKAVQKAGEILDTPGRVVRGVLAAGAPQQPGKPFKAPFADIPGNITEAITNPNSFRGVDAGALAKVPDRGPSLGPLHITPKTLSAFGYETAADPLNLLGAGKADDLLKGGVKSGAKETVEQGTEDVLKSRVREAVQTKFKPSTAGADIGGGAPMLSPTIKGTTGAVEVGDSGIQEALARKKQGLHVPDNPVTYGKEGSTRRKVVGSIFNPSANMPQEVHVANNARIGVQNSLYTDFARSELSAAREVKAAFAESPPTYIGKGKSPLVGTAVDYLERPSMYADVSPRLEAAKTAWGQSQLDNLNRVRAQYDGSSIEPFTARDPNGVYVPHADLDSDLDTAVQRTSHSLSSRPGITRTRSAPTLFSATKAHPEFKPELDLEKLAEYHSNALAYVAGNNTFKAGVGGLTHSQLVEQFEPKLFAKMGLLKQRLQNLRASRGTLDQKTAQAVDDFLGSQQSPDDLDSLLQGIEPTVRRGANTGINLPGINAEIAKVRAQIKRLKPLWENADTGNYVRSPDTFLYHTPEAAKAIDSVLKTKVNNAFIEGILSAADEYRGMAMGGGDFSPLTIRGAVAAASHPDVALFHGATMAKIAVGGREALAKAVDPEVVRRYEFATGRKFGSIEPEFRQSGKGLERIPYVGRGVAALNDTLQRITDFGDLKAWENDSKFLQAQGFPQNIADHEAANSTAKFTLRMNPAETGRSSQRARIERLPVVSTSFRYAPPLIAKDISTAASKLAIGVAKNYGNPKAAWDSLDGRERLALLRGTMLATTLAGTSVASAIASANANGKNPADAVRDVLDPTSSRFMSLIVGDKGSIGLGGPIRSSIRALAPGYVNGKMVPFARVPNFLRSSTLPALGAGIDLIRNEDYFGNKIVKGDFPENFARAIEYGMENSNLIAGAPMADIRTGQGNPLTDTISQIGGTNFFETTPTEKLDEASRGQYGKGFYDLEPAQQDEIKKAHPDLWNAAVNQGSPERKAGEEIKQRYAQQQQSRDDLLLSGQITRQQWLDMYDESRDKKAGEFMQVYGNKPITKPRNPRDKYVQFIQQATDSNTGMVDWDQVDTKVAGLTQADRDYIDRNVGLDDTPLTGILRQVRRTYSERRELPKYRGFTADQADDIDTVWQEVRNNARSADKLDMLRALRFYMADNPGIDPYTLIGVRKRINGRLRQTPLRKQFDRIHPELQVFYGSGKLTKMEVDYLTKQMQEDAA